MPDAPIPDAPMPDAPMSPLPLAADFPEAGREQWLKLVEAALKGRPFERLASRSYDGIPIEPLYAPASGTGALPGRRPGMAWELAQRLDHPDPAVANAQALNDLENGATGLSLVFAGAVGARGFGLDPSPAAIARALDGIYLDGAAIDLDLPVDDDGAARAIAALVEQRGTAPRTALIRFGLAPAAESFGSTAADLVARGFEGPLAVADGRLVHDAGGSEAQELGYVLSAAVAALRALEARGITPEKARRLVYFRLAADADQLLTVAKFRAVRILWARVEEACGFAPVPAFVAAETAWRMMARRDPHVNLLRCTVAAFSAAVGGADAIAVLPFTAALGLPDGFARRLARNTQLILGEESNLAKVADPAAGSGAFEALTTELCTAAWALFQEVEAAGGLAATLKSGAIEEKVAKARAAREKAVATGKDPLTGVSAFPNLGEAPVKVLDGAPAALATPHGLAPVRLAEPFEAMREASDHALAGTGARPTIFLATLGRPADFLPRATFARNFFAAGGIAAVEPPGEAKDGEAIAAAFKASGAGLACICSSDEIYAREAAAVAKSLAQAGARHIYLAGRPGEQEHALRAAGVGGFVFAGGDLLATLREAHAMLAADLPKK